MYLIYIYCLRGSAATLGTTKQEIVGSNPDRGKTKYRSVYYIYERLPQIKKNYLGTSYIKGDAEFDIYIYIFT